jgi:hypothetical protein
VVTAPGRCGDGMILTLGTLPWERRRALRALHGGKSCADLAFGGAEESKLGGCVSRSTPVFLWCCEPVWERGGGGRTVSRPLAGTVDCCFEHVYRVGKSCISLASP